MLRASSCFQRLLLLGLTALLVSCNKADHTSQVVIIGRSDGPFQNSSLRSPAGQLLRGATADGLVGLDEMGQVIPALADRWIVSNDGLSYIFRLRNGTWPDGKPITAETVQAGLRQAIGAMQATPMALDLAGIAEIRIMTARVIELRLNHPQPELLSILAQPELGVLRKGRGAGLMLLGRKDTTTTLSPIKPEKRGLSAVEGWDERARKLQLTGLAAGKAVERFTAGKADLVLGGTIAELPPKDVPGLPRGSIRFDPVQGLYGLAVAHSDGFLSKAENREAIAMTIDRDSLMASFDLDGWSATSRLIPARVEDYTGKPDERWSNLNLAQRRTNAAARVVKWRGSKPGLDSVRLRLAMPTGLGADRIFARLADDFKQIGLTAVRVGETDQADLRWVDVVARYPRSMWYFNQLSCANKRWICIAEADKLVSEAHDTPDQTRQAELIAQAEAKLTEANVFIPFGPPVRWSLVRSGTTGFALNRLGYHPLMPLALLPK